MLSPSVAAWELSLLTGGLLRSAAHYTGVVVVVTCILIAAPHNRNRSFRDCLGSLFIARVQKTSVATEPPEGPPLGREYGVGKFHKDCSDVIATINQANADYRAGYYPHEKDTCNLIAADWQPWSYPCSKVPPAPPSRPATVQPAVLRPRQQPKSSPNNCSTPLQPVPRSITQDAPRWPGSGENREPKSGSYRSRYPVTNHVRW